MGCEMLERSAVKIARSVLRRGHRSNSVALFDRPTFELVAIFPLAWVAFDGHEHLPTPPSNMIC